LLSGVVDLSLRKLLTMVAVLCATEGGGASITSADLDRIRDAALPCWPPPAQGWSPSAPDVEIQVRLGDDGLVLSADIVGPADDPSLAEMQQRARRALLRCQPYPVPAEQQGPFVVRMKFPMERR
jgi:hypothetical protein